MSNLYFRPNLYPGRSLYVIFTVSNTVHRRRVAFIANSDKSWPCWWWSAGAVRSADSWCTCHTRTARWASGRSSGGRTGRPLCPWTRTGRRAGFRWVRCNGLRAGPGGRGARAAWEPLCSWPTARPKWSRCLRNGPGFERTLWRYYFR